MSVIKINKDIKTNSRNDWRDPLYLNDILTLEEKSIHKKAKDFCQSNKTGVLKFSTL